MKILIVLPAYNEAKILAGNVERIVDWCRLNLEIDWQLTIADNASTDETAAIGQALAEKYSQVNYFFISQAGKGAAIVESWRRFAADIYCFMDADLATDLSALPLLIAGIGDGHDIALGNRFDKKSQVTRSMSRWFFSYGYAWAARLLLKTKIQDLPCGFKAINQKVKADILPQVINTKWFFDSELVIRAEKAGYKIAAIPVNWRDPQVSTDKSRVNPLAVAAAYLKELIKLRKIL